MTDAAGWIDQSYSGTTAPGRVSRFTFPGVLTNFAAFGATVKINLASKAFEVKASFTLGDRGMISLTAQPVTIETFYSGHSIMVTIPPGSFRQTQQGTFVFQGVIQGIQLAAELKPEGGKSYTLQVRGMRVPERSDLPSGNPVTVWLAIGNNGGSIEVNAEFPP